MQLKIAIIIKIIYFFINGVIPYVSAKNKKGS